MKYHTLIFFLISQFYSFSLKSQSNHCIELYGAYDTITKDGNFIKYHVSDLQVKLEYGNNNYRAYYPDQFDCDVADSWVPKLKYDNRDFMLLHYGCGSSCWGLILLPLNPKEQIKVFMNDLAYDPESTNLVYTDNENLLIENLSTHNIKTVKLPKCEAASMIYCLDSVSINKSELKYQFYGPNRIDDKPIMKKYNVKIK